LGYAIVKFLYILNYLFKQAFYDAFYVRRCHFSINLNHVMCTCSFYLLF